MNISVMTHFDGFIDRDKKKYLDIGLVLSDWLNEFNGDFLLESDDENIDNDRTAKEIVNSIRQKLSNEQNIKVQKGSEHALMKLLIIFFTKYGKTEKYNLDSFEFLLNTNGFKIPHYENLYFDEFKKQITGMPFIPNNIVDTLETYSTNNACSREYKNLSLLDFYIAIAFEVLKRKYKYSICQHCGKIFFKKSNRTENNKKYCERKSPLRNGKYTCNEIVKIVSEQLEYHRNKEYKRLWGIAKEYDAHEKYQKRLNSFIIACDDYKQKIKKGASIKLLNDYEEYLIDRKNTRKKNEIKR